MSDGRVLAQKAGSLIASQVVAVAIIAGFLWQGGYEAWAKGLIYGGLLTSALAAMLSATLQSAAGTEKGQGASILYRGAVERFLLVIAAIIFAAVYLKLNIGAVVAGMIIAHLVHFVEAARWHLSGRKPKDSGIGE